MDDPALDERAHQQALKGLRRINRVTNSTRMIWKTILNHHNDLPRPIKILDLACGGGDVLVDISRRAQKAGIEVELTGWDLSPTAIAVTNQMADLNNMSIQTGIANALVDEFPQDQDVIFCSLFLHHLSHDDAKLLLSKMASSTNGLMIVSDLLRTQFGYRLAWLGTRLLSRSHIVHVDGPLSVEAAFTLAEVSALKDECGLADAKLHSFLPARFLLESKTLRGETDD